MRGTVRFPQEPIFPSMDSANDERDDFHPVEGAFAPLIAVGVAGGVLIGLGLLTDLSPLWRPSFFAAGGMTILVVLLMLVTCLRWRALHRWVFQTPLEEKIHFSVGLALWERWRRDDRARLRRKWAGFLVVFALGIGIGVLFAVLPSPSGERVSPGGLAVAAAFGALFLILVGAASFHLRIFELAPARVTLGRGFARVGNDILDFRGRGLEVLGARLDEGEPYGELIVDYTLESETAKHAHEWRAPVPPEKLGAVRDWIGDWMEGSSPADGA